MLFKISLGVARTISSLASLLSAACKQAHCSGCCSGCCFIQLLNSEAMPGASSCLWPLGRLGSVHVAHDRRGIASPKVVLLIIPEMSMCASTQEYRMQASWGLLSTNKMPANDYICVLGLPLTGQTNEMKSYIVTITQSLTKCAGGTQGACPPCMLKWTTAS